MLYEPPPSRAPFVIAGAIALIVGGGALFFWRAESETESPVVKIASEAGPALAPTPLPAGTFDARELIGRFEAVVQRKHLPGVREKVDDLVALLKLTGVQPLAPDANTAAIDRAIQERSRLLGSTLPMATALLDDAQLRALHDAVEEEIAELKKRRTTR